MNSRTNILHKGLRLSNLDNIKKTLLRINFKKNSDFFFLLLLICKIYLFASDFVNHIWKHDLFNELKITKSIFSFIHRIQEHINI